MATVRTGGCLCGAVRYENGGEPMFSLQCHCRDCQRSSGAAHVAAVRMQRPGFRITQGAPKRYVAAADSGNEITRVFCGDWGRRSMSRSRPGRTSSGSPSRLSTTRAQRLREANIFTKSAQPWDHFDPAIPLYETYPQGKSYSA